MTITINIPAVSELAKSIDNLANAMASQKVQYQQIETPVDAAEKLRQLAHTDTPEVETPEVETPPTGLTPSEKAKAVISEEIIALGGTPPEKGSVKKFQEVCCDLRQQAEDKRISEMPEEPPVEVETPEEPPVEVEKPAGNVDHSLENIRMLAGSIVKNNEEEGKKQLLGCLKDAGAKSITLLFEGQPEAVDAFVEALLKHTSKTLVEIVAEAKAEEA